MKKTGIILLFIPLLFCLNNFAPQKITSDAKDSSVVITIAVTGDLMCHSGQFNYAKIKSDSFDFRSSFRFIKPILSSADFAFGNFETVTAGTEKSYSGYPFFNTPDEYPSALADAGFDMLTTANNHSLDQWEAGVRRTIKVISEKKMGYNGTFESEKDRDSVRIYNIKGIRTAFLAYSYGTNGLPVPKGKSYLINLIDTSLIKKDILAAKKLNADLIIVHFHFGEEYKRIPSDFQKRLVSKTAEYGADIIIGGHPHVIQTSEFIKTNGNKTDSTFVIYSMGNFISNQQKRYTDAGLILTITIEKKFTTAKTSFRGINVLPTWVYKGNTGEKNEYVVIPELPGYPDFHLSETSLHKMAQAFEDTREMLIKSAVKPGYPNP